MTNIYSEEGFFINPSFKITHMEDKVRRWEATGILEGIDDKELLTKYLESMLNYYVNNSKPLDKIDEEISIWIFPLIRRVYKHNKSIDIFDLKSKFEGYVKDGKMEMYGLQFANFQGIDIELECLAYFCEKYVEETLDNVKPLS